MLTALMLAMAMAGLFCGAASLILNRREHAADQAAAAHRRGEPDR